MKWKVYLSSRYPDISIKPSRGISPAKEKLLSVDIDRMIKINVIEEAASSPWTSQVTFNYMQLPIRMLFRFL